MTEMTDSEIIQVLGGVTAVAKLIKISPPSVHGWLEGGIPELRLKELAAQIEIKAPGRFSRRSRWPDTYHIYWPELAAAHANLALAATENVAST